MTNQRFSPRQYLDFQVIRGFLVYRVLINRACPSDIGKSCVFFPMPVKTSHVTLDIEVVALRELDRYLP